MNDLITSYLLLQGECTLKGIGTFYMSPGHAVCDLASKEILPPDYQIRFRDTQAGNEEQFLRYIARTEQCSVEEAGSRLGQWLQRVRNQLDLHGEIALSFIGTLSQKPNGTITFSSAGPISPFRAVRAERVIHDQDVHEMVVGDKISNSGEMNRLLKHQPVAGLNKMWLTALILAIIAVLIIVLYFITDGFGMHLSPDNAPATYMSK